jgi:hypothetical protein
MRKSILLFTLVALLATTSSLALEKFGEASPALTPLGGDFLFEGFEGSFPPTGWTSMTSGAAYPWVQSDLQAYDGIYSAYVQWGEAGQVQDEWLVTEAVNTTGMTGLKLEFQETGAFWADYGMEHEILVSTTIPGDPGAFTSVLVMTPATYPADWLNTAGTWGRLEVDLSAYAGMATVYVAIRYQGEYGDDWWVDDLRIFEPVDHDVMAVEVMPDGDIWTSGTDIVPQLVVRNAGANTETFNVEMDIDHNGSNFYTETASVTGLLPGEETTVDFPTFTTEVGLYEMTGTTLLSGDENPGNDTAYAENGCYSGSRTPLGMLVTNWGCGPCVQANQALDAYMPTQGNDVALIRVHAWWPSSNDPMYLDNTEQCDHLINNTPTGADYAPHLWMDNYVDAGSDGAGFENYFEDQKLVGSPLTMEIAYDEGSSEATVTIDVLDPMPGGDWVLYVAVTEDRVDALGPNGERYHSQAFRYVFPDLNGTLISTDIGTEQYVVSLTLDPGWNYNNLRATAWVQDPDPVGIIMNSATMFLNPDRWEPLLITGPGPAATNPPLVRVFPAVPDPEFMYEFSAYGAPSNGVNVSCGDVTGDGLDDILTGAGPGEIYGPHVRGFTVNGTPLPDLSFFAYGTLKYGVNVAAGDIDADGYDEIITGAGPGAVFGPHVRAWNYDGTPGVTSISGVSYFAYGTPKWGVNVSCGDIDGDGYDEIVSGAGPGAVYGPHVRGWNVDGGASASIPAVSYFAYGTLKYGVNVTCGDMDGDGIDEIITGAGPGAVFGPHVRGWNYDGATVAAMSGINFFAWSPDDARYGANVYAGADLDGNGMNELVVGCGPDANLGTLVNIYTYDGTECTEWTSFEAYSDMTLTHGTVVAAGKF